MCGGCQRMDKIKSVRWGRSCWIFWENPVTQKLLDIISGFSEQSGKSWTGFQAAEQLGLTREGLPRAYGHAEPGVLQERALGWDQMWKVSKYFQWTFSKARPLSLQKGLWGCQFRIGHRFKINKGAKAIIYLWVVEKPAHSKPGCHLWRWNELSSGTLNGNNKSSLRLCTRNE